MRLAVVLTVGVIVSTVGCGRGEPKNLQPMVAAFGSYSVMARPVSPDGPGPVDGRCENCSGTGKVGDGRVMVDCPVCGGDGVIDPGEEPVEHDPMEVSLDDLSSPPPKQPKAVSPTRTVLIECKDGRCRTVR